MQLLILGGTIFLGRYLVEAALERGHTVTLFNRGQHNTDLFPQVEKLRGDRDGNLGALSGRQWDAVVDTCGYVPRIVRASAELLASAAEHYTFISTISVYANFAQPNMDERAPVGTLADAANEEVNGDTYGPLKALCERAAEAAFPGRALIIRPGLIVGPHDPTDRFTYWPRRVAGGGAVLAPGSAALPVQIIDVRDLAEWTIRIVERRQTGVYNATGPDTPLTLGDVLAASEAETASDAEIIWVDEAFLLERNVEPWVELPLWLPTSDASYTGMTHINCHKAFEAGLVFRPLRDTVGATLAWDAKRPPDTERRAGMQPMREHALLTEWRAASQAVSDHSDYSSGSM